MRHIGFCLALAAFSTLAPGQWRQQPADPIMRAPFGTSYREALEAFLRTPPATITRDEQSGKVVERKGHFTVTRTERPFDVPVKATYGFTLKDSLLGYVLITYIEADQVRGSLPGGRDSLWARLIRAYGEPAKRTAEQEYTQFVWSRSGTLIVATRSDVKARTLVVSFTPDRQAR